MARASQEIAFARIDTDLDLSTARVRMIRYVADQVVDVSGSPPGYRLELALLPKPKGGCAGFPEHWGPHRFEPVGELFLIPPGESLRARGEAIDQLSIVCEFEPEALHGWLDAEPCWTGRNLAGHLDIASPAIKTALRRMHEEICDPGFATPTFCELLAMQTAVDLARYCGAAEIRPFAGGLAPWRLRRIDERLGDEVATPGLGELAALCGLSIRQLTRGYRASRGRSIGEDIARSRVEQAKRLLATATPIHRIARALGFNAPANFSSAFARATGESPRRFRSRIAASRAIR